MKDAALFFNIHVLTLICDHEVLDQVNKSETLEKVIEIGLLHEVADLRFTEKMSSLVSYYYFPGWRDGSPNVVIFRRN